MFFKHFKNVFLRQDNSKTNLKCLKDVLRRLGKDFQRYQHYKQLKDIV